MVLLTVHDPDQVLAAGRQGRLNLGCGRLDRRRDRDIHDDRDATGRLERHPVGLLTHASKNRVAELRQLLGCCLVGGTVTNLLAPAPKSKRQSNWQWGGGGSRLPVAPWLLPPARSPKMRR